MDYQNIQLLQLNQKNEFSRVHIPLPSSKSESNRALVIDALTEGKNTVKNLAEARDTQTMIRLLRTNPAVFDVLDAGTTMRFLTAFVAVTNQQKVMLLIRLKDQVHRSTDLHLFAYQLYTTSDIHLKSRCSPGKKHPLL